MDPFMIDSTAKVKSVSKHVFQVHSYQKPTFCAHCNKLLVGLARQGYQCKRCEINVHKKCRKDAEGTCIEVIVGHHNFLDKTYTHPTFCNACEKLLTGVFKQGLQCSECGCNVHEKCQGKIEVQCEKTQQRLGKVERPKTSQSQGAKPKKASEGVTFEKISPSPKQKRKKDASPQQEIKFETLDAGSAFKKQEIPKAREESTLSIASSPSLDSRSSPVKSQYRPPSSYTMDSELSDEKARMIAEEIDPPTSTFCCPCCSFCL